MEDDIFTWIGVLAFPLAVASLLFALLSTGALNYSFNSTQFIVNETNVSINQTYLSEFGNITYINQTVNITANSTQFDSLNPLTIKTSWLSSFINWLFGNGVNSNLNMQTNNITNIIKSTYANSSYGIWSNSTDIIIGYIGGL